MEISVTFVIPRNFTSEPSSLSRVALRPLHLQRNLTRTMTRPPTLLEPIHHRSWRVPKQRHIGTRLDARGAHMGHRPGQTGSG